MSALQRAKLADFTHAPVIISLLMRDDLGLPMYAPSVHRWYLQINVKNFHGKLTTVVRAQNDDTSKTANITYTIFDRTYCDGVLKIGEIRRSVSC